MEEPLLVDAEVAARFGAGLAAGFGAALAAGLRAAGAGALTDGADVTTDAVEPGSSGMLVTTVVRCGAAERRALRGRDTGAGLREGADVDELGVGVVAGTLRAGPVGPTAAAAGPAGRDERSRSAVDRLADAGAVTGGGSGRRSAVPDEPLS